MGTDQQRRRWLLAGLLVPALVACDPGWSLHARNDSSEAVVIRVRTPAYTDVYRLPAGFVGYVAGDIGKSEATVELLDSDCSMVESRQPPAYGPALVTVASDGALTVEPTTEPISEPTEDPPDAEEIRGACGSTKAP